MRISRAPLVIAAALIAAIVGWWAYGHFAGTVGGSTITVYYTKLDGTTEAPWQVTLGPARDAQSVAFYAAAQALAGPPSDVSAVRFPVGTRVRAVRIEGSTVAVDLTGVRFNGGSFAESGAFKSLVWTMTALPAINAVAVRIDGTKVTTLPGGHLELDEPLNRSSW